MGMDQYLLIQFLMGWTSIYQLFWCSRGVQGFDTLPYIYTYYAHIVGYTTSIFPVVPVECVVWWLSIDNYCIQLMCIYPYVSWHDICEYGLSTPLENQQKLITQYPSGKPAKTNTVTKTSLWWGRLQGAVRSCTFYSPALFVFLSVYVCSICFMLGWGGLGEVGWGNKVLALAHPLAVMPSTFLLATSEELL